MISLREQQFIGSHEKWGKFTILGSLHFNKTFLAILLKRTNIVADIVQSSRTPAPQSPANLSGPSFATGLFRKPSLVFLRHLPTVDFLLPTRGS